MEILLVTRFVFSGRTCRQNSGCHNKTMVNISTDHLDTLVSSSRAGIRAARSGLTVNILPTARWQKRSRTSRRDGNVLTIDNQPKHALCMSWHIRRSFLIQCYLKHKEISRNLSALFNIKLAHWLVIIIWVEKGSRKYREVGSRRSSRCVQMDIYTEKVKTSLSRPPLLFRSSNFKQAVPPWVYMLSHFYLFYISFCTWFVSIFQGLSRCLYITRNHTNRVKGSIRATAVWSQDK